MIISSKGRYALRVMLELAQYGGDGAYIRLGDIAQRQGISRKYLESIMTALAKAGLVESALGKAGGYRLVRPAEDYPIGEILQAAEGELMPVSCLAMDGKPCDRSGSCITLPFWRGLEEHINAYVNSYTLRDLLEPRGQENNESRGSSAFTLSCGTVFVLRGKFFLIHINHINHRIRIICKCHRIFILRLIIRILKPGP